MKLRTRTSMSHEPRGFLSIMRMGDLWIALGLTMMSVAYLWPFRNTLPFLDRDEGIILQGATRILHGELPYRDFFSFYTPGSYYWNAFILKFFGDSILVPHTVLVVYGALFSALTFLLARHLQASRKAAALVTGLLLVCSLPARFVIIHSWDTTMAGLLALGAAVLFLRTSNHLLACLVGCFTALAILFNQARGMGLLLGLVMAFMLLKFRMGNKQLKPGYFVSMGTALALPLIFTVVFFALQGGLRPMVECLLWPMRHYSTSNRLPYGFMTMSTENWNELFVQPPLVQRALHFFIVSPIVIICVLPIVVVLVSLWCALSRRSDLDRGQVSVAILCGAVVLGSLLSTVVARPDFLHVTFIAPLFFFLLPWLFTTWSAPFHSLRKFAPLVMVYVLVSFAAYGLTLTWNAKNAALWLETRRGTLRTINPHDAISFIQNNVPPGSKLLVHPYLPMYSFLTRTVSPISYDYLQPGMHSQRQFQDAASQLARLKPEAVVFEPQFAERIPNSWPNTPVSTILQDPVADYIALNYRMCRVLDADSTALFLFMVRKDLDCAAGTAIPHDRQSTASAR
ncbi:MAG: ArnT family glycosyltransferase [Candidatus Angelobacter sp.]